MPPSVTRTRAKYVASPALNILFSNKSSSRSQASSSNSKQPHRVSLSSSRSSFRSSRSSSLPMSALSERLEVDLGELVANFKRGVPIRDRRYRLTTYKKCFIGSEAVQWMLTSGVAETREDAVRIGLLMQEAGLIEHCVRDHDFKDELLFYKFIENSERGGVPSTAGRLVSWADFIATPIQPARSLQPRMSGALSDDENTPTVGQVDTSFWPMDQENVILLDNVHPPEWIEPSFNGVYNLLVIGAGAGGLVASSGAADLGAKVALIEANVLGGACLNVGCIPSKSLIHAANLAHTLKHPERLQEAGLSFDGAVHVDFAQTMRRLRGLRAQISDDISAKRFTRKLGVDVYFGYAKFTSENTVEVNGKILTFKKAVIATGGFPFIPDIPGLRDLYRKSLAAMGNVPHPAVMTHETFFNMTSLPKRLAVIGTGVVGMELGQAMQRLGSAVTMFGRSGRVLPKEDEDLSQIVMDQMTRDGVSFHLMVCKFVSVELTGLVSAKGYEEIRLTTKEDWERKEYLFDAVLVCTGRRANVATLNLEAAGVQYDTLGLQVDDMLQTTNPRIYGVGDCCCNWYKYTHSADFMARMVIRNALFLGKEKMSNLLIPYVTCTSPEIAHVGLYKPDMKERDIKYRTFERYFVENDRAVCESATQGMVRIHVEERSDVILGASIVGAGAGNMISELTLAMQSKTGLGSLASVIHPYPTTGEAIRQVGDLYNRSRLTTTAKQLRRGVIRVQR